MTERFGVRRFPVLTTIVFAITAVMSVVQLLVPGMLAGLERTPAGLHGQWWRSVTSLFVQDGGIYGTVSNLIFLVLVGTVAEQVLSRPRWLLHYFGVGVVSEFIAYAWQPTGGGNSIAICGLTGAVVLALWCGDTHLPRVTSPVLMIWCAALIATLSTAALIPAIVLGVLAAVLARVGIERGMAAQRPVALAVLVTGIGLAIAQNIHGAALLVGLAMTAGLPARQHDPALADDRA